MSGLEIIGVAASILQIAEMGRKLSIKLFYFGRRIKDANQAIQSLSSDVSLTCSALHELGTALEQDDQTKVCSEQAFHTATSILEECKNVFQNIEDAIDKQNPGPGASRIQRGIRQVTIAFFGPDLDILKGNLERLKSTMLLMLNVIMYAAQLRRYVEFPNFAQGIS